MFLTEGTIADARRRIEDAAVTCQIWDGGYEKCGNCMRIVTVIHDRVGKRRCVDCCEVHGHVEFIGNSSGPSWFGLRERIDSDIDRACGSGCQQFSNFAPPQHSVGHRVAIALAGIKRVTVQLASRLSR